MLRPGNGCVLVMKAFESSPVAGDEKELWTLGKGIGDMVQVMLSDPWLGLKLMAAWRDWIKFPVLPTVSIAGLGVKEGSIELA